MDDEDEHIEFEFKKLEHLQIQYIKYTSREKGWSSTDCAKVKAAMIVKSHTFTGPIQASDYNRRVRDASLRVARWASWSLLHHLQG